MCFRIVGRITSQLFPRRLRRPNAISADARLFPILAAAVFGSLIFCTAAAAADPFVFNVNDTADEPDLDLGDSLCKTAANKCTLRAAVMQARVIPNVNSTINVPGGTYTLGLPIDPNKGSLKFTFAIGNPLITITGAGEGLTTIDANGTDGVMYINSGRSVNISGMSLVNGNSFGPGGGVYNAGTLNLTDVTIFNCTVPSSNGGGIYNASGATLSLTHVTLNKDSAVDGGGIASAGTLSINHSLILDNTSTEAGGGIYSNHGFTVDFSTIRGNKGQYGAGIWTIGSLTLSQSSLDGNQATAEGGGLYNSSAMITADRSTISRNTADRGGGIIVYGTMSMTNSTVSNNQARTDGGGIHNSGVSKAYNSTIAYNQADTNADGIGDGGGIYVSSGTFELHNTIVAGNRLVFDNSNSDCFGFLALYGVTGFEGGEQCFGVGSVIFVDSAKELGILKNSGGSTETIGLLAGSDLIGNGAADECRDADGHFLNSDQRGNPRPPISQGCDIGAFEFNELFRSTFDPPIP